MWTTLIGAFDYYYRNRRRPTFEYILFDGFNDTEEDVIRFVKLSKRIPCKVNLIAFPLDCVYRDVGLGRH